jgi:hypothetical protein
MRCRSRAAGVPARRAAPTPRPWPAPAGARDEQVVHPGEVDRCTAQRLAVQPQRHPGAGITRSRWPCRRPWRRARPPPARAQHSLTRSPAPAGRPPAAHQRADPVVSGAATGRRRAEAANPRRGGGARISRRSGRWSAPAAAAAGRRRRHRRPPAPGASAPPAAPPQRRNGGSSASGEESWSKQAAGTGCASAREEPPGGRRAYSSSAPAPRPPRRVRRRRPPSGSAAASPAGPPGPAVEPCHRRRRRRASAGVHPAWVMPSWSRWASAPRARDGSTGVAATPRQSRTAARWRSTAGEVARRSTGPSGFLMAGRLGSRTVSGPSWRSSAPRAGCR